MSLTRFTRFPVRSTIRQFSVLAPRRADDKAKTFDADKGSAGREFQSDGKVGGTAQKVGGPFAADGSVGKEFTKQGSVGGKAQEMAEDGKDNKSVFDKDGAIGKEFQADGKIGQLGEKVGGPFSKDGAVGKEFTDKGSVGGTIQENTKS